MSSYRALQIAVVLTLACTNVVAFVGIRQLASAHGWMAKTRSTPICIEATFYGMDPEEPDNFSWFDDDPFQSSEPLGLEGLSNERAKLARVVAAFSPPGHALDLRNIADVNVLQVDGNHMDLQATICERDSCAAVEVPVIFPHPCTDVNHMNECVIDNLYELDQEAELRLKHAEWETTNYELHQEMNRQRMELLDHDHVNFPQWWIAPNVIPGLAEECEAMHRLLNDAEFREEILSLAKSGLIHPELVVEGAALTAVGPAGMILKGRLQGGDVLEIPIAFPIQATNVDQLRDLVEAALESAGRQ